MKSFRALGASVAYAIIAAGVLVGIYALTPYNSRVHLVDSYAPIIIAGIPGVLAYLKSKDAAKSAEHTGHLLNGDLDRRIDENVKQSLVEYMETREHHSRKEDQ